MDIQDASGTSTEPPQPLRARVGQWVRLLALATVGLWVVSGFVWWPLVIGIGLGLAARVASVLVPRSWRRWLYTGVLLAVVLVLMVATTVWQWLLVGGAVALVPAIRRWPRRIPLVTAAATLLVGAAGVGVQAWTEHQAQQEAAQQAHDLTVARMLPRSPNAVVFALVTMIGRNDPMTCALFSPAAEAQFAAAYGAPDCEQAVQLLAAQVRDPLRYQSPTGGFDAVPGAHSLITTCTMTWTSIIEPDVPDPGPRLGVMTAEAQLSEGYLITGYRLC